MPRKVKPTKLLTRQRSYFLLETLIIFLGIFLFSLILLFFSYLELNYIVYGILFYFLRAIILILAVSIFLYVANFALEKRRALFISESERSATINFLNLFRIKKSNIKYQILYGFLFLFILFIPLDFLTYLLIPEMLSYSKNVLLVSVTNYYFKDTYFIFLLTLLISQFFIAVYEESLTRGFLTNRGSDYVNPMSAVIISSFYFGLGHFSYVMNPAAKGLPIVFPFIWFVEAFFIGIVLSLFILKKHWIFPIILAHFLNNVISGHTIWNYIQGNDFMNMVFYIYIPMLIIGVILFIWQFSRIKDAIKMGLREFRQYFRNDERIKEETDHKIIRILLDFLFGLFIFIIGFFLL
ncbi:MAG: lysostaphin resistance A-like protein [Promethearchaeota archaeon]